MMEYDYVDAGYPLTLEENEWRGWNDPSYLSYFDKIRFFVFPFIAHRLYYWASLWSTRNVDRISFISEYCRDSYFIHMPRWFFILYWADRLNYWEVKKRKEATR